MGDFFKPWRRKIGVVTLLMACVFAAGWVKSFSTVDSFDSSLFPKETLRSHSLPSGEHPTTDRWPLLAIHYEILISAKPLL